MASIRLRFVGYDDLVGRFIAMGENGFWADHVECQLPDGSTIGAHNPGGVQIHLPGYDDGWSRQLFVDVPCTQEQADAFHAALHAAIGTPYDLGAIVEMVESVFAGSTQDWDKGPAEICSVLIDSLAVTSGIFKSSPAGRLTTPRDVLERCGVLIVVAEPEPRPSPKAAA